MTESKFDYLLHKPNGEWQMVFCGLITVQCNGFAGG